MEVKELSQLRFLNMEINQLKQRRQELISRAEKITNVITDMPRGGQGLDVKDELIDLIDLIALKEKQCIIEQRRIERFIACAPDSLTRQILALRFVNGLSWRQVAFSVGGGNTEGSVKMICYRYINKSNK